jgi:hypothetical protein
LIVSYDRDTGQRRWTYDTSTDGSAQQFHGEMVRHEDQLLVPADPIGGHLYAFDEATGALNWKWPSQTGVSSDLLVVDDYVIAVTLANELVALDVYTGENVWTTDGAPDVRGIHPTSPTPVVVDNDLIWGRKDGWLSRRNVDTGEVLWMQDLTAEVSTDLLFHGGRVILGTSDGQLRAINPVDGTSLAATMFEMAPTYRWLPVDERLVVGMIGEGGSGRELVCVDAETLEVKWTLSAPSNNTWTTSQPTVARGLVLAGTDEPLLYGVDPESGKVTWTSDVEKSPRIIKVVDDRMYVGTFAGTLMAFRWE